MLQFINRYNVSFLLVALILSERASIAQSNIKGGVETTSGFLQVYLGGPATKKNLSVNEKDITRVLPKENAYKNINIFLLNTEVKDAVAPHDEQFAMPAEGDNTFRRVNDSLYEIYIHNPGKQVLFVYRDNELFTVGVKGAMSGGFNAPNLMGEDIDTLTVTGGGRWERYNVLPFNPFLYGLELFIRNKKDKPGHELVTFKILFQFPSPALIGLRTDTAIINKRLANPSLRYYDNIEFDKEHTHPSMRARKPIKLNLKNAQHIFKKNENSIFFVFEHFAGLYRNDYFDNLQYKLDNQSDWILTPLSYNPSILLEKVAPGKHKLQVRYPVQDAPAFIYYFEVLTDWKDSPLWLILACILSTAFILFLFFRARLKRAAEKVKKNRLELQAIQSQLNPHFMFNALGSIQHLVHNDKQSADLYLTEFGTLLRNSLYNNEKEMVPLSAELQTLNSYIRLEKLRFRFTYEQR